MAVYIITGDGAGKTTSSLGMAMRSLGHGHKVVMIQWMKHWKNTGEYKIQRVLGKNYRVYQFGYPGWLKLSKSDAKFGSHKYKVHSAENIDREYALRGLRKAEEVVKKEKPHLLILDEICLAVASGLVTSDEVLQLLDKIPKKMDVVLTGRHAPRKLIKRADFVNEVVAKKYSSRQRAKKGIQY